MEVTMGSVSLSASINETLNCRMSGDTALAQVCRVTPVSRVSVFLRRPFVSAKHAAFLRGGRSSSSWGSFPEDIAGLGCRLCIKGRKESRVSHNSRWQASAVAELSGTDTEDIGSSAREDLSNADAAVHNIEEGDTLTAIAKRYNTSVSRLAADNGIEDVDVLHTGEELVVHFPAAGLRKVSSRMNSKTSDIADVARAKASTKSARALRTATSSGHDTPTFSHVGEHPSFPVGTLAQVVIPLLLIAPVVGFCVRCAVDYIQERIQKEIRIRQSELETYYSRHRPRVNRWQGILDEDREEVPDYNEAAAASDSLDEYQFRNERQIPAGYVSMRAMNEVSIAKETDEERSSRQSQDYEEIRKSYAELESTYMKFLSDSGLSRSGYWRGSLTQLQEEV